jgi:thymidine kinase
MSDRGSIRVTIGPMFSGKSTHLMETAKRCVIAGVDILFLIPAGDNRFVDTTVHLNKSHDGLIMKAVRANDLTQDPPQMRHGIRAIFIDEGQFFTGLMEFCLRHKRAGRSVHVAGLTSDFNGEPWHEIQALVPAHADSVQLRPGVCVICQGDALYSRKIAGSKDITVEYGADDKYVSTCLLHLTEPETVPMSIIQRRAEAVEKVKNLISLS